MDFDSFDLDRSRLEFFFKLSLLAKRQLFKPFGQTDIQIKLYWDAGVKLNDLFLLWNNENNVLLCERVWVDYDVTSIATKHYDWF